MKKIQQVTTIVLVLLAIGKAGYSQPVISGPACVVPGTVYHYKINSPINRQNNVMKVCVTGGVIADRNGAVSCTPEGGASLSSVLIKWNNSSTGSFTVTTPQGNATFTVTITSPLKPGAIDAAVKNQNINNKGVPSVITCSLDSGGACNPAYTYQWQQSDNAVSWTDIAGATGKNLTVTDSLSKTMYYRRKTTEKTSGAIAYSDVAAVYINSTGYIEKQRNPDSEAITTVQLRRTERPGSCCDTGDKTKIQSLDGKTGNSTYEQAI